ncbi:LysR family transcriptional regulator [Jannaschia donghaensis]|uniref:Gcv operon activator n=1 Tax=Jannaschia donghaensis TaxID=420998 RepID=A0A0M6YE84_9RHOB|nr:LysR family transcriptional regulator [Jannaschia donghaensis]CTQ48290.1 Gcv operon activator [Jannaschia donghaensis]
MNWADLPSLPALRAFETAARLGGFSPAARELNVTPAAIAQHVRTVEAHLETALVQRDGRGIAVTDAGLRLADGLSQGFAAIADAVDQLRADQAIRPLSLAVTPGFAAEWLMPRLGDFWMRHPDIQVNILPDVGLADLRSDGVDMAIRWGDGAWPGVNSELLTEGDFWVVAHPRLLGGRKVGTLEEVRHLPWLLEHYVLERRDLLAQAGLNPDDLTVKVMATNALSLAGALNGLGVAVMSRPVVEREVAAGNLVRICDLTEAPLGYHMVTLPGRRSERLRILRKWLRAQVTTAV